MNENEYNGTMSHASPCPICTASSRPYVASKVQPDDYFRSGQGYMIAAGGTDSLPINRCVACGHGFTPLRITAQELSQWYAQAPHDEAFVSQKMARYKTADRVLGKIETLQPAKGKLLDIGSGPGLFLEAARRRGWQVSGTEPSGWARVWAQTHLGISVLEGGYEALAALPAESVDVVCLFDVIEHVLDPHALIAASARVLKKGGWLVLTTPAFDSFLARVMGRRWYCIFPAHIHYFTGSSLNRVLRDHGLSWRLQRSHVRYLGLRYLLVRMLHFLGWRRDITVNREHIFIPVNLGDEFEVYAQKG